ncbi:MAG: o-succinylbenzoate synthase [Symploca sp. SIO2G7]|nr:o-succinylbenzoate synthase [Symploca sp. SIO2G7]
MDLTHILHSFQKYLRRSIRTINSNAETVKSYHCCLLPVACCLLSPANFQLGARSQFNRYSYLLPAGKSALQAWQTPWQQGYRTFKWKIGTATVETELKLFNQLAQELPPSAQLRLDANGGLSESATHQWLKTADKVGIVEFVEQPLPPEQFDSMLKMTYLYTTPIALDESVATLNQLETAYQRGWRGIFVIKAAIAGSPKRLRELCQAYHLDTVFSSALTTAIATQAALQLAAELSNPQRTVGFGVNHWFTEDEETWLEQLWNNH